MTGLAFLGMVANADQRLRRAQSRMERYKNAVEYVNSLRRTTGVSESRDVTKHENRVIRYMEAMEEVARLTDEKNAVIDMVEEKLALLQTVNGEEMIKAHYIEFKKMPDIAREFHYSRQGVYKLLGRAMTELDNLLEMESPSDYSRPWLTEGDKKLCYNSNRENGQEA